MIKENNTWKPGTAPVAVIMISLNEAHNMEAVLQSLSGWAQEVFLVDSCSIDATIDIALKHGVNVVQRQFKGFGDQWNFALNSLPINAHWTMKIDPDERLTTELKSSLEQMMTKGDQEGIIVPNRLWFMGEVLPVQLRSLRVWRTGSCRFTDVAVNEHPLVKGDIQQAQGHLEHHDSPNLDHWVVKQNRYTTGEAISQFLQCDLAVPPKLFGSTLERRMWIKKYFWRFPGRFTALFIYHFIILGSWRVGRVGWIWSHLRTEVYRIWEYKKYEIEKTGRIPAKIPSHSGQPDPRVPFYD